MPIKFAREKKLPTPPPGRTTARRGRNGHMVAAPTSLPSIGTGAQHDQMSSARRWSSDGNGEVARGWSDDERGYLKTKLRDVIAERFEILAFLGQGSFGQVVKAIDHDTQRLVAVKIIRNRKRFTQQAMHELAILEYLRTRNCPKAIRFHEKIVFHGHICFSFELMSLDLYRFLKAGGFCGVSIALVRRFAVQILQCLRFLRRHGIVHCDIKPENILLVNSAKSNIVVADFGSSCHEGQSAYTYIQSRFYRAPEVILGLPYGCAIDMWSLGCVLAEMFLGCPLFPGEEERDQFACLAEILGPPPVALAEASRRRALFFEHDATPRVFVNSRGRERRPGAKSLEKVMRCPEPDFISFLQECFRWTPSERLTPDAALNHPFLTQQKSTPVAKEEFRIPPPPLSTRQHALGSLTHRSHLKIQDDTADEGSKTHRAARRPNFMVPTKALRARHSGRPGETAPRNVDKRGGARVAAPLHRGPLVPAQLPSLISKER